jgi:hypothetical protein
VWPRRARAAAATRARPAAALWPPPHRAEMWAPALLGLLLLFRTPAGGRGVEVRWYTSAGSRGQFDAERAHMTGIFSCCTGFHINPNASFSCPGAASWHARNMGGPLPNMTVDHVMSVCPGCDDRGSGVPFNWSAARAAIPAIVDCANAGNVTGFLIDWEPPAHADHWPAALMTAAAVDFASFANKLAVALHSHGHRLGLDLSGDQGSPIDEFSAFAQHGPEVDYFTLMATYSYFDIPEKNHPTQHYSDRLMVMDALQSGIPPHKLACGIETETHKAPNESRWNATTLGSFVVRHITFHLLRGDCLEPCSLSVALCCYVRFCSAGSNRSGWVALMFGAGTSIRRGRSTKLSHGCLLSSITSCTSSDGTLLCVGTGVKNMRRLNVCVYWVCGSVVFCCG